MKCNEIQEWMPDVAAGFSEPTPDESKHIESQYSEYLAAQAERERQREQELQEERAEAARRLNSKREKENLAPRRR